MAKYSIELPDNHSVSSGSRGVDDKRTVTVDIAKLAPHILAECLLHGLTQKIADAASGAKRYAEENEMDEGEARDVLMTKALDGLYAGEWTRHRAAGAAVSEEQSIRRSIAKRVAKAKFGSKSPQWAKFTGLDASAQAAKLDEWVEVMGTAIDDEVKDELARRKAQAAAKAKLSKTVDFSL